jgi:type IX secretion system PorP/SprF family membrane protein
MKKAFLTLFFGLTLAAAFAQEEAIYSQYHVLPILVNPGYTGFEDQHQFLLNARSTWTGFPGKPNTYTVMYNGPVGDKLALGGGVFSEKIGSMNVFKLQLNYAFRFKLQKAKIGLGLSTQFLRQQIDPSLLDNGLVDKRDEVLENMVNGQQIFDASIGAHLLYDDRFFVSLALPNTVRARLDDVPTGGSNPNPSTSSNTGLFSHYILQVGYIVHVASQNFKLIPSLTMRSILNTPNQIDLNLQARFLDDKLIAGLTVRPSLTSQKTDKGASVFLLGTKFKQFQLFYSYDVSFSNFQRYNSGSHELSIALNLPHKAPPATPGTTELYK